MRPDIHPKYKDLTVIFTNGDKFKTKSTYNKGDLLLDVDFKNHPAWSGEASKLNDKATAVAAFKKKFSGLSFSAKKKKAD